MPAVAAPRPPHELAGYERYYTTAKKHDPLKQSLSTAAARCKDHISWCWQLPKFDKIFGSVVHALQLGDVRKKLVQVHFLTQDKYAQGLFAWHTDGWDLSLTAEQESRLVVAACQLSNDMVTAMQVSGFPSPHLYMGQGAGVIFHGGCLHRSVNWCAGNDRVVTKVVFFFLM